MKTGSMSSAPSFSRAGVPSVKFECPCGAMVGGDDVRPEVIEMFEQKHADCKEATDG